MAYRSPEQALETVQSDGCSTAGSRGLYHVLAVSYDSGRHQSSIEFPNHEDLRGFYGHTRPPSRLLITDDLDTKEEYRPKLAEDGMLEYVRFIGDRSREGVALIKGDLFFDKGKSTCVGVILERKLHDNSSLVRLAISSLNDRDIKRLGVDLLIRRTVKNIQLLLMGLQAEISSNPLSKHLHVDSLAAGLIPDMKGVTDNSWLLWDDLKARRALVAVMEDPFFFWERYQRLIALGPYRGK